MCQDFIPSAVRRFRTSAIKKFPLVKFSEEGLGAERFLIESNRQREKTKVQRLREYKRLKEIEAKLAAERQKESRAKPGERADRREVSVRPKLDAPRSKGRADTRAAVTVGLKRSTAEKGLEVLNRAERGEPKAKAILEKLDRNQTSIDRAYRLRFELRILRVLEHSEPFHRFDANLTVFATTGDCTPRVVFLGRR